MRRKGQLPIHAVVQDVCPQTGTDGALLLYSSPHSVIISIFKLPQTSCKYTQDSVSWLLVRMLSLVKMESEARV